MEGRRHIVYITVDTGGLPISGGQTNLLRQPGQLPNQVQLLRVLQQREIWVLGAADAVPLQVPQNALNAGVGVLHIINRVFVVLANGQTQVKFQMGVGGPRIEEIPSGVARNFIQQVGQGDRLACPLAHADGLAVPHQPHQLHQHDFQPVGSVQPQDIQSGFQPSHMAVMVRAPNIDDSVKAPLFKFVPMVGDIRGKIGIKAVGPAKHVVFVAAVLAGAQPERPFFFIGSAFLGQQVYRFLHIAGFMEGGFKEPHIVRNPVFFQVRPHFGQVFLQAEFHQLRPAFRFRRLAVSVAVQVVKFPSQLPDIVAVIAVFREGEGVLPVQQLKIPGLQRLGEFIDLVACVVDVKFPRHLGAGALQYLGQAIAQHAASRVAHVHGACGVGGDKLHHNFLRLVLPRAAILPPLFGNILQNAGKISRRQPQVEKAGPGHFAGGEQRALQLSLSANRLGDFSGVHAQRLGGLHGEGGSKIAVFHILGNLHRGRRKGMLRQKPLGRRLPVGAENQVGGLIHGDAHMIHIR